MGLVVLAHSTKPRQVNFSAVNGNQGLNRLEKYFNIYDCLVKSLKVKSALKSAEKSLKGLEKSKN